MEVSRPGRKSFWRYLGREERVFGGISAGMEEFLEVSRPGRKSFFRYLGRDGTVQKRMFLTDLLAHNNRDRGGHVRAMG